MKRTSTLVLAGVTAAGCLLAIPQAALAGVPACGNHSLAVSATAEQGATGHSNFVLLFKNKTTHTCSLFGYPGLDALNASGGVMTHARRTLTGFTGGSTPGRPTSVV